MSLADGQQTTVMVEIEGRSVLTKFIILPKAKGNRTLLGTYFLSSVGLVLDVKNTCWYFWDNPTHKYPFGEELGTPSIVEKMSSNTCQLVEEEGESLTSAQKEKLNLLMSRVKNCPDCNKYKASNQKPSGLLQTPVPPNVLKPWPLICSGPLPESEDGKRWILIIEDCITKWVELFVLPNATAKECAITLVEEVPLRYGIPRRLISDNGTQFVSAKLPFIRFALNTAKCETTGQTAAFLNFGRELRTPSEVVNDIRVVIQNDNFVPEITPYLEKFAEFSTQIREVVEEQQDSRKLYADKKRKSCSSISTWKTCLCSITSAEQRCARKKCQANATHRDGLYVILTQRSPSSYEIASLDNPVEPLGVYHTSALTPCNNDKVKPLIPLRKRDHPPKVPQTPGSSSGRRRNQGGVYM
ncbi:integrase catalytic domain-containing protein [Trichonephila clavipes]|nr:integrase catalytic domain-containing protein [Trichonephila clavipes]